MRRSLLIFLLLDLTALIILGSAFLAIRNLTEVSGPPYTAGQVTAGLRQHPQEWTGRTIELRARVLPWVGPCPASAFAACDFYTLLDVPIVRPGMHGPPLSARPIGTSSPTLLLHPQPDPLLGRLRQLPVLGRLLPNPQPVLSGDLHRVTIQPAPTSSVCPQQPCYWAVLSDAGAPGPSGTARSSRWRLPGHLHPR